VKPESTRHLDKVRQALEQACSVAGIERAEAAGRAAYLAAFQAAQALIFERSRQDAQSASWRSCSILQASKDIQELGADPSRFLSRAYDFQAVADYEIGPDATVPPAEATAATEAAEYFVDPISRVTGNSVVAGTAVDVDRLAGDEAAVVADQE
jgi:uncharacterized protein (UPF0332 family)